MLSLPALSHSLSFAFSHDPTFKTAPPPPPPSFLPARERALGSLTADAYCSPSPWPLVCLTVYTSLFSVCLSLLLCVCVSVNLN